ncbi:hypothetical protein BpHYR1_017919 [Brachionus plicatilis]|uniref:Uncharacterized protein n=1 Tax=Brachionus plicatilis TaxID=10195 RepID=A0A3M7SXK8_BRAPC|nr:hypothetical protein BpHYR1_017919 [Brachionus plicatilis]
MSKINPIVYDPLKDFNVIFDCNRAGLNRSIPVVVKLVEEYREGFEYSHLSLNRNDLDRKKIIPDKLF